MDRSQHRGCRAQSVLLINKMRNFLYVTLVVSFTTREVFSAEPNYISPLDAAIKLHRQHVLRNRFLLEERRSNSKSNDELKRDLIVGGSPADSQEYRSYAVTDPSDNSGGLCGATLIYPDILVSAAHCGVGGIFNNGVLMNIGATSIYGSDAIDRIEIVDQLIHPAYDSASLSNDIMLIKLSSPSSSPPSTWNTDDLVPENNEVLTIIGHGKTELGSASEFLLEATVFVVDDDTCAAAYSRSASSTIDTDVVLCAVSDESTTCSGDSGGPLFRGSLLVGVVSFGIVSEFDDSCISSFPSGFTRISAFSDFISQSICTLSASPPESCFASVDLPVPVPTQPPIITPPTMPPGTSKPTQIPIFPPLPFASIFTPFTPAPIISTINLAPISLSPSPTPSTKNSSNPSSVPSIKDSSNPSWVPSYNPSPIPTYQSNRPSTLPSVYFSVEPSVFPTIAPINEETRSSENIGNTTTVTTIEGENRDFGIDIQSSSYHGKADTYNIVVVGIVLHGLALMYM